MAIYSASVKVISRSTGRNATAAAAYRAQDRIDDERTGQTFDYTRKGGVVHTEVMAPDEAPAWCQDRATLWNAVEQTERRKDAQLAREVVVALPHELSSEQRLALVRDYVRQEFVRLGMVADVAVHAPSRQGDQRNHHAHVLLTMRHLEEKGFGKKNRAWNHREQLVRWRERWQEAANDHLARAGSGERIDHRSYTRQGMRRKPTYHVGPSATAMERAGEATELGDINRRIRAENAAQVFDSFTPQRPVLVGRELNEAIVKDLDPTAAETWQQRLAADETRWRPKYQAYQRQQHDLVDGVRKELVDTGRLQRLHDHQGAVVGYTTPALATQRATVLERVKSLARSPEHRPATGDQLIRAANRHQWTGEQKRTVQAVMGKGGFKTVRDVDAAKLQAIREGGEAAGYRVVALTHSHKAREAMEDIGYKEARTVDSFVWRADRKDLHPKAKEAVAFEPKTLVVVEGAQTLDRQRLDDITRHAHAQGVKVVLTRNDDGESRSRDDLYVDIEKHAKVSQRLDPADFQRTEEAAQTEPEAKVSSPPQRPRDLGPVPDTHAGNPGQLFEQAVANRLTMMGRGATAELHEAGRKLGEFAKEKADAARQSIVDAVERRRSPSQGAIETSGRSPLSQTSAKAPDRPKDVEKLVQQRGAVNQDTQDLSKTAAGKKQPSERTAAKKPTPDPEKKTFKRIVESNPKPGHDF